MNFTPCLNKRDLIKTLEYYDVNRVNHYDLSTWVREVPYLETKERWGVRSFNWGWKGFKPYATTQEVLEMWILGKINTKDNYICDSMYENDLNHLIYNGEVMLYKDEYNVWQYTGFLNKTKGITCRDAQNGVKFTVINNRHQVPKLVFNLIWEKKLINTVIEFSIYDIGVGIYNKNLLIWELRRY